MSIYTLIDGTSVLLRRVSKSPMFIILRIAN